MQVTGCTKDGENSMRDKLERVAAYAGCTLLAAATVILPVIAIRGAAWLSLYIHGVV